MRAWTPSSRVKPHEVGTGAIDASNKPGYRIFSFDNALPPVGKGPISVTIQVR